MTQKMGGNPDPPVFVVGCGRSGTTLLRLMLDSHPDLAIPGESHFVPTLWRARGHYIADGVLDVDRLVGAIVRSREFHQWGVPEELARRRVQDLRPTTFGGVLEAVYLAYADHRGKRRWGDKTPQYVRIIPLLHELFPDARFVHIIRDGRDVALSYLSVPWGPRDIWTAARKWRRDVSAGRTAGSALGPERYLEITYERLVAEPKQTLEEVCAFAALPFDERMLQHHRDADRRLEAPADETEFHAASTRAVTSGLRDWRSQMSPAHVMSFEAVAGPLLSDLGYERRHVSLPVGSRIRAALRMRALDVSVAVRRAARSAKATLRTMAFGRPAGVEVDG